MALIYCPECQKEISDKAASCINCGCPIQNVKDNIARIKIQQHPTIQNCVISIRDVNGNTIAPSVFSGSIVELEIQGDGEAAIVFHGPLGGKMKTAFVRGGGKYIAEWGKMFVQPRIVNCIEVDYFV